MKRTFLPVLLLFFLLAGCDDPYGDKVAVNAKSNVYYKGAGVTKADAQKLGAFLLNKKFFDTEHEKSVQLLNDNGTYLVRFVVDKQAFEKDRENALLGFRVWQYWISENVFRGAATRLQLANNEFADLQEVGEFSDEEKAMLQAEQSGATAPDSNAVQPASETNQ